MLNPTFGVANVFARWLPWVHDNPQWLNSEKLALGCVIVITVWKGFPFYGLVILAALQTVPGSLYEAARVDGASPWGRFRYVTIPAILPTLSLLAILSSIFAIQQFTLIYLTTGGGPVTATNDARDRHLPAGVPLLRLLVRLDGRRRGRAHLRARGRAVHLHREAGRRGELA